MKRNQVKLRDLVPRACGRDINTCGVSGFAWRILITFVTVISIVTRSRLDR
jgi:hypothetical protein